MAASRRFLSASRWLCLLLLALLAACARPPAPPPVPASKPPQQPVVIPVPPPSLKLWPNRDAIQSACLNDLEAMGAQFELVAQAEIGRDGCTLVNGVKLHRTTLELPRPVELTCPMALRLMEFERDVLKPLTWQYFGKPLRRLNHAGGFVCKRMTGNFTCSDPSFAYAFHATRRGESRRRPRTCECRRSRTPRCRSCCRRCGS